MGAYNSSSQLQSFPSFHLAVPKWHLLRQPDTTDKMLADTVLNYSWRRTEIEGKRMGEDRVAEEGKRRGL